MIPLFPDKADPVELPDITPEMVDRIVALGRDIEEMAVNQSRLAELAGLGASPHSQSWLDVFNGYVGVLLVAFLVTLVATPVMRYLAMANGVVDHPSDPRKVHRVPVAYLGGVAVYLGIMAGILLSYLGIHEPMLVEFHDSLPETPIGALDYRFVPPWIMLGLTIIMVIGLIDDVMGISPRVKIGGQLLAAAALAYGDIGVNVAQGLLSPTIGKLLHNPELVYSISLGFESPFFGSSIEIDIIYWTGTAVIAVFVLGACNASNLIDGLDGLLSGVTGIATIGLLAIAMLMAFTSPGPRDAQRIILCMALLGACLGFLPHNYKPATIFLGDCGSLLLGFSTIVIILSLGDTGRTDLVIAGLVVYAIPILDTVLAIVRRKMSGKSMSDADSDHLHHMLKRAFGVQGAVFVMYGMGAAFAIIGVLLAASGARFVYSLALLCASFIVVYSMKITRRKQQELKATELAATASPSELASESPSEPGSASA